MAVKVGNIINYLMTTRKLPYEKAVEYFKYNISKQVVLHNSSNFIDIVQKQVNGIGLNITINDVNWVELYEKSSNYKVLCSKLEKYIKENVPYMFVRSGTKSRSIKIFLH